MSGRQQNRGGAAVGFLSDIDPVEASAVVYMRMWFDGPTQQCQVWNDFAKTLGPDHARNALRSFEHLWKLCSLHGRRPLMRHSVSCKCLGGDEACFASIVGYAAEGNREDAFLMAANLVRPDIAPAVVALAEEFGHALQRMMTQTSAQFENNVVPMAPRDRRHLH
ncbi:MAG: hypothetical protein AAFN80_02665 [Pseudomonadota bacterium]